MAKLRNPKFGMEYILLILLCFVRTDVTKVVPDVCPGKMIDSAGLQPLPAARHHTAPTVTL